MQKKCVVVNDSSILDTPISFHLSKTSNAPFFCHRMLEWLGQYKSYIDLYENKEWDYNKKISNDYELINLNGFHSITNITPISRSFYKFREMIIDFDLISNDKYDIRYAALAEGPGGFIESFLYYRKKDFLGKDDYVLGITLSGDSNEIPNWNKAKKIFKMSNTHFFEEGDGTGNLYNIKNILAFRRRFSGNTADLVTSDGGFDYSKNFNKQEEMSLKLIYAEIVTAYGCNVKGGHFILKLFDIFTLPTLKLIKLLSLFYNEIILTKPFTSRPANSEKYIVCKYFKGFDEKVFQNLLYNLEHWKDETLILNDIQGIHLEQEFINTISIFNLNMFKIQITNILKTITYMKINIDGVDLDIIRKKQIEYAINWCRKYGIGINYKSKYIFNY